MKVKAADLERLALRAILGFGYTAAEAAEILDVLMYAQLRGNNQGVVKLVNPGIPKAPTTPITVTREGPLSALIDGGGNHAILVLNRAVEVARAKTSEHGLGAVGVNHLNTSSGAIGYYARRLAADGFIGIVLAGASPVVAAAGSYERVFGTNPIAIALPTVAEPVVLDMATAAMTFFGVVEARMAGRPLPPNVAYDSRGVSTTSAAEASEGAIRTFDQGPKSSGLAFMIQALTGPLVGASFVGIGDVAGNWGGHLVLGIAPEMFAGDREFRVGVSAMVERVKASKRLPGVEEIFVPGERGDRRANASRECGEIEIDEQLYEGLRARAGMTGLAP